MKSEEALKAERAKELKKFFRASYAPFDNNSPFSVPRESEILEAREENRCLRFQDDESETRAAILFKKYKVAGTLRDFAQNELRVEAGTFVISDVACSPGFEREAANLVMMHFYNVPTLVEIYEENVALRAKLVERGLVYLATKVSAYGEVKGVYSLNAKTSPVEYDGVEIATLRICREPFLSGRERNSILGELEQYSRVVANPWENHYSMYNKSDSWAALSLRGFSTVPSFIIKPSEMDRRWKREHEATLRACATVVNTLAWEHFPTVQAILERIPGKKQRVRFMLLKPGGGELKRHCDIQDKEAGTRDNMVTRFHVPLVTNERVMFRAWDSRGHANDLHMPERSLCYLDQRKPHTARNDGDANRVHLVVDVHATEETRRVIEPHTLAHAPAPGVMLRRFNSRQLRLDEGDNS